ncbi:hypothetical protein F5Y02DRAFT_368654, partial [Annulohypoxylon stygium]
MLRPCSFVSMCMFYLWLLCAGVTEIRCYSCFERCCGWLLLLPDDPPFGDRDFRSGNGRGWNGWNMRGRGWLYGLTI